MGRYEILKLVGEGSFGWVYQAIDNYTSQFVAIKQLKPNGDPSACEPEILALQNLEHPNIVSLKGVEHQDDDVFFIFEYMEGSLGDLINERRSRRIPFSEAEIRSLSRQVLQGLEFMHHQRGFMHRDLKPENLLVNNGVIKISDLGTATEIDCGDQFHHHYVTTRWYRAPEMLFRAFVKHERLRPFEYDEKVDMWAMGTIIAELFLMWPLFKGDDAPDQLYKICHVIGAPTWDSWTEGMFLATFMKMPKLGPENGVGLRALMPYASESAIDLIESLCSWDPSKRPSAKEALQHPFFKRGQNVDAPPGFSYCTHTRNNVVPKMTELSTMQPILGAY
ncbi:cyclin-dependent kinase F-3-like [Rosa rugosa]|uniref:cyclin-dependent kinase F-3-like n=1 Tax=Rosa rugosa TaxID=74645 RepID=UPI002B418608|nr:cyclin-dependent kinase F-3-like [Rosa rugosa]